ncbi:hypothetical protein HAX54_042086, partial [Datura stramonium]|nr:hypothetical protein [Datura stramonium]
MAQKGRVHRPREPLLGSLEKQQWSLMDYHGSKHKRRSNMPQRIGLMKAASHLSSQHSGQGL